MAPEPPIVCSLSATELPVRLAQIADLGRAALLDTHHDERRAVLRFASRAGVRERLAAVVAAESECCAFLEMRISEVADTLVLTIAAPDGAGVVVAELVAAFGGQARPA